MADLLSIDKVYEMPVVTGMDMAVTGGRAVRARELFRTDMSGTPSKRCLEESSDEKFNLETLINREFFRIITDVG